jgi:hypothetical protein
MARYRLIGQQIQGQEVNTAALTLDQQRSSEPQEIVYQTADLNEVKAIVKAGGYYRDRETFITVTNVVDTANLVPSPATIPTKD